MSWNMDLLWLLDWDLHHWLPWFSVLWTQTELHMSLNYTMCFPGSLVCRWLMVGLVLWATPCNEYIGYFKYYIPYDTYMCCNNVYNRFYWFYFSREPWLIQIYIHNEDLSIYLPLFIYLSIYLSIYLISWRLLGKFQQWLRSVILVRVLQLYMFR